MKRLLMAVLVLAWPAFQALQAQSNLSKADQKTLIFMAEEEKMARDFYQAMEAKWEAKVFNHIVGAEQRHLGRTEELAASLDVKLPKGMVDGEAGKYRNNDIQQLYDELAALGSQSLEGALRAGARLEEINIRDLKMALETTTDGTARGTYRSLLEASGNHLRAFNKNLAAQGITYSPVLLPQADFDAIVDSGGNGQGCQGQKAQSGKGCCQGKGAKQGGCCQGGRKGKGKQPAN
ncbi:MAG: DUF2202 domain-containing protein [Phaeodactylibacter sp.]|nr:DUF2202 domain-containing protein [Phaeodactylibacter sp.]MCB9292012.1 DUF2202 domain-containing protein [Lewinellaceae bacterium]